MKLGENDYLLRQSFSPSFIRIGQNCGFFTNDQFFACFCFFTQTLVHQISLGTAFLIMSKSESSFFLQDPRFRRVQPKEKSCKFFLYFSKNCGHDIFIPLETAQHLIYYSNSFLLKESKIGFQLMNIQKELRCYLQIKSVSYYIRNSLCFIKLKIVIYIPNKVQKACKKTLIVNVKDKAVMCYLHPVIRHFFLVAHFA